MEIYEPAEDSWMLADWLSKQNLEQARVLEIGTGSGILAKIAAQKGADVIATDINFSALRQLAHSGLKLICGDLLTMIKPSAKFDLIIFNPPYLPPEPPTDPRWSGGAPLIRAFLSQAKEHLAQNGQIVFVLSSLTGIQPDQFEILDQRSFFFERIWLVRVKKSQSK